MNIHCDSSLAQACIVVEGQEPIIINYGTPSTNNVGEYRAVWFALDIAMERNYKGVIILTDSKLVVGQTVGLDGQVWKCKKAHLLPLRDTVRALLKDSRAELKWIEREKNLAGLVLGD